MLAITGLGVPQISQVQAYADGTLIKAADDPNVYIINNNLKVWVRSLEVFNNCGYNWQGLTNVASLDEVATADLIKRADNPDVYRLEKNFKRKLASIEIFESYGLDWNKIATVCPYVLDSYSRAPLIQPEGSVNIYRVDADFIRHHYPTWESFVNDGKQMRDVITVNQMEFGSYAQGTPMGGDGDQGDQGDQGDGQTVPPTSAPTLTDPGVSIVSGNGFTLTWTAVSGATSYTLERGTEATMSSPTTIYTGSTTSFTENLTPANATNYFYRVRGSNSAGVSSWSNLVDMQVTTTGAPSSPTLSVPGASVSAGTPFTLTWSSVSNVTIYVLEQDTNSSFSSATTIYSGSDTSYVHTLSPVNTTTYYWRVQARNNIGHSPWSNLVNMEVTAGTTPGVPQAPVLTGPSSPLSSGAPYTISWQAVSGATGYTLQEDIDSSFSSPTNYNLGVLQNSYLFSGYQPAATVTRYYRARASNDQGTSSWSNTVSVQITGLATMVNNVPDANQPPTNILAAATVANFCTPISAANITEYWDTVAGNANAQGINAGLGVATAAEYIGWFMNTNGLGSVDRLPGIGLGTSIANITPGLTDWVIWDAQTPTPFGFDSPVLVAPAAAKSSYVSWDITTEDTTVSNQAAAWNHYKSEIDAGRPVIISFSFWNPLTTAKTLGDLSFYDWGPQIFHSFEAVEAPSNIEEEWSYEQTDPEYSVGHSVTGVGYLAQYDPGDGGGARNWAIVHDNWSTTPEDVAIPWNNWLATTSVEPKANAVPLVPSLTDPGVSLASGTAYNVSWARVNGASFYCYDQADNSSFNNSSGGCTIDGSILSMPGINSPGGKTYYFRVKACNGYGCSSWSNLVDMDVSVSVPRDYASLQAAIDAVSAGSTIYVSAGNYSENITVNKALTIQSQSGALQTTITAANAEADVFRITADNVNIDGFTVTGATGGAKSGFYLTGADNCNISNNIISGNWFGIWLDYATNNLLDNNTVKLNSSLGIMLYQSSHDNTISNSEVFSNSNTGIQIRAVQHGGSGASNRNVVRNCNVHDNTGVGIDIYGSANNEVDACIIRGNGPGTFNVGGLVISDYSTNNLIQNTEISQNNGNGINLGYATSQNTIKTTDIASNSGYGIKSWDANNNKIYRNNFRNNTSGHVTLSNTNNSWSSPEPITYSYQGQTKRSYMGNYWSGYSGADTNGDGIGETPYNFSGKSDNYPLVQLKSNYN